MARRQLKHALLRTFAPALVRASLRLLRCTVRIEYRHEEKAFELARGGRTIAFAFWHCDMIAVLFAASDYMKRQLGRIAVLASLSDDGELLARTVQPFGVDVVRGSSSRGARSGFKGLERHLNEAGHVGVAVDGPRGPRQVAKLGVTVLAKDSGCPIIPFTVRYDRSWTFNSWDRTIVPKPFSHYVATFHDPIAVPPSADRAELERARSRIEQILLGG